MGREAVALAPLRFVFPSGTAPERQFLTWSNKFEARGSEAVRCELAEERQREPLQRAAVAAFKALGVGGAAGWARVDMRLEEATGDVYVVEVNCIPNVFYPRGNVLGDDLVVEESFPGAQPALLDMMLATKQMQLGWGRDRNDHVAAVYDAFAPAYNTFWEASGLHNMQAFFAANFDFAGSVLDMACGTGAVGRVLHQQGVEAIITGIDVSEGMLQMPEVKKHYKQPILIGPMEELIMVTHAPSPGACMAARGYIC